MKLSTDVHIVCISYLGPTRIKYVDTEQPTAVQTVNILAPALALNIA